MNCNDHLDSPEGIWGADIVRKRGAGDDEGIRGVKSEDGDGVVDVDVQGVSEQEGDVRMLSQEITEWIGQEARIRHPTEWRSVTFRWSRFKLVASMAWVQCSLFFFFLQ